MANASLNTLFYFCNDVAPMRRFYSELLGLEETFYRNDENAGWFTCRVGEINLVFIRGREAFPVPEDFSRQPGFTGEGPEAHSWVLQYSMVEFEGIVIRLQAARVPSLTPAPVEPQPGDRMFVVRDPMGLTIELYAVSEV